MDREIKAKWIAALRSRKYKQFRGGLSNGVNYCCLGVLAKIQGAPVEEMLQYATKLEFEDRNYRAGLSVEECNILVCMNDGMGCEPRSFDHIAGYVQAMIEEE